MKYYLIVGEASGDLHASHLMRALKKEDAEADFRFFGGDLMQAEGGTMVRHYRELAYMGFIPVLMHLPTILRAQKECVADIRAWQPDVVILVDYPGFNLRVAKELSRCDIRGCEGTKVRGCENSDKGNLAPSHPRTPQPRIYYYISPKIWAWKEWRIKSIRRYVDELFSILPFEVDFFEGKHHYPIHYVGNPTADEVSEYLRAAKASNDSFTDDNGIEPDKPIIALLCGSRRQEIKDNLPAMLEATDDLVANGGYQAVIACAPAIEPEYYHQFTTGHNVLLLPAGGTYRLLSKAHAALVTSGTATLETALFRVPQVVCYETPLPRLIGWLRRRILKVRFISLVNLIADREVVSELVADSFSVDNIRHQLDSILNGPRRQQMLEGYDDVWRRLGNENAPQCAAATMTRLLRTRQGQTD